MTNWLRKGTLMLERAYPAVRDATDDQWDRATAAAIDLLDAEGRSSNRRLDALRARIHAARFITMAVEASKKEQA